MRAPSLRSSVVRPGVILLVVITLLTLFAVVGVTFVLFAQAEASSARVYREGEALVRPDMDPEMLLAYFLNQLVYDVPDDAGGAFSALRGHSLARSMYGYNSDVGASNNVPFNGAGRLRYQQAFGGIGNQENFNLVNFQYFGGDSFLRDPERFGSRANLAAPSGPWAGGYNVPYTYPDLNNVYLAAMQADGKVLTQSYHRRWVFNPNHALNDPTNPNWTNAAGKYLILRPRPSDHTPQFPYPEDGGGDVKNRGDAPGYFDPVTQQWCNNDSIWIDLNFPVMKLPDGRRFKALFAPFIEDLDNRININVHGNVYGLAPGQCGLSPDQSHHISNQGWGPWEVNYEKVVSAMEGALPEGRHLFVGNGPTKGRYDFPNFWGQWTFAVPEDPYVPKGPFYSRTDFDMDWPYGITFRAPGGTTSCFPDLQYWNPYSNGNFYETQSHPLMYNFFDPPNNYMYGATMQDRRFGPSHLEALLRYGDKGSPALTSDLFKLCPQSFGNPRTRRMVTTHAFDIDRPGVTPWVWDPSAAAYQIAGASLYPTGNAIGFPALNAPLPNLPSNSEFAADWRAASAALGRIDLNRILAKYPAVDPNTNQITDMAAFDKAQQARQQLAKDIFECFRKVTGAADPATADPTTAEYKGLRWLAQLAVNIVDFCDTDDYATPFNWNPRFSTDVNNGWVFGTEQPRLVLNEVYCEIANDTADLNANLAQKPYQVRFWVELHNPFMITPAGYDNFPVSENSAARLKTTPAGTPIYKVTIADTIGTLRNADNVRGLLDDNVIKAEVADFTPEDANGVPQPTIANTEYILVRPANGSTTGGNGNNQGFYVLGPREDFPGSDPNRPTATLRVKDQPINNKPSRMYYTLPNTTDLTQPLPKHTLLLRRLACPTLPPQDDVNQPRYNPYITVDYVTDVPTSDGVTVTNTAVRNPGPPAVDMRTSYGRKHPYAANPHTSLQLAQAPAQPLTNQPQHTFFSINNPVTSPFDWLTFIDRTLISPIEILQVSAFKPHELTQQFVTMDSNNPPNVQRFTHRAPWFDQNARIYRAFEFFETGPRMQGTSVGGRSTGKINLNTVWDEEVLQALGDPQITNYFTAADITTVYQRLKAQRSPQGYPTANDRPLRGFATPNTAAADPQYPAGIGIDDTFFQADATDANPDPAQKRRLFDFNLPAQGNGHPYFKYELMNKIFGHVTTRSNVFAVWVTVGFFEVTDDSDPNRPPKLGAEIGRAENRHVRHRMFAVVDRTNLTVNPAQARSPGQRPFYTNTTAAADSGTTTVTVPGISGMYEDLFFSIGTGTQLVIDAGSNQELVTVANADFATKTITVNAPFAKRHERGVPITNVGAATWLGNPGPQTQFDPRNPLHVGVVRYFSIIE